MCAREKAGEKYGKEKGGREDASFQRTGRRNVYRYVPNRIRNKDETDVRSLCNRIVHRENVQHIFLIRRSFFDSLDNDKLDLEK